MRAPGGGGGGGGTSAPSADIPVRSAFETTPLFRPNLVVPASGTLHVPLPLPDNVGSFNVRAYAVTANSQFGVGEAQQVARRPISLVSSTPRIVRVGDDFSCGFTVTAADPSFRGDVTVTATVVRGGLALSEAGSQNVRLSGAGPQEVVFSFTASALENAQLQFSASSAAGNDAFTTDLPVLGAQDGVCVATSMAIDGSDAGTPWAEGIVLPDAVAGSGSLELSAGVGYLPTVQALSAALINLPEHDHLNAMALVNSLAPAAMLDTYSLSKRDALASSTSAQIAASFTELARFTDSDGLRYFLDKPDAWNGQVYINAHLNAWAAYVAQRLSDSGAAGIDADVVAQWRTAMITGLIREAQMAEAREYQFSNYELLAAARLVLGVDSDWVPEDTALSSTVSGWLAMDTLVARATSDGCSDFCKAATAMVLLKADATSAQGTTILRGMVERMRVTGRTGYISQGHQGHATDMRSNSLFLSGAALAMGAGHMIDGFSTLTLQKLANYVAQGSADQRWGGRYATAVDVHRGFGLSDYDTMTHSNAPDVQLSVSSGGQQILAGAFTPGHTDPISSSTRWEDLASPPRPLAFTATGSGELSVAASMTFVPSQIYNSPVYRGLYVEKVIQALDPDTGLPTGAPLQAVRLGQMVAVTIQVTTADDVQDLILEDWTAGGLEPVDPNVDHSALNAGSNCGGLYHSMGRVGGMAGGGRAPPMMGGGDMMMPPPMPPSYGRPSRGGGGGGGGGFDAGAYFYWFSCTSFQRQTRPERVSYYSRFVRAGTHSMTYQAMAATSGRFVLPPAKASLASQPEVMGLSAGGAFAVSRTALSPAEQFLPVGRAAVDCPADCPSDCDVTTGRCNAVAALTAPVGGKAPGGVGSGHRRQLAGYVL